MKANIVIQSNIKQEQNSLLIPNNRENPPSPNERLSKDYRIGDIKASTYASHKTHARISLKQRSYSRNYGLVCNLGKRCQTKPNTSQNITLMQDILNLAKTEWVKHAIHNC